MLHFFYFIRKLGQFSKDYVNVMICLFPLKIFYLCSLGGEVV